MTTNNQQNHYLYWPYCTSPEQVLRRLLLCFFCYFVIQQGKMTLSANLRKASRNDAHTNTPSPPTKSFPTKSP